MHKSRTGRASGNCLQKDAQGKLGFLLFFGLRISKLVLFWEGRGELLIGGGLIQVLLTLIVKEKKALMALIYHAGPCFSKTKPYFATVLFTHRPFHLLHPVKYMLLFQWSVLNVGDISANVYFRKRIWVEKDTLVCGTWEQGVATSQCSQRRGALFSGCVPEREPHRCIYQKYEVPSPFPDQSLCLPSPFPLVSCDQSHCWVITPLLKNLTEFPIAYSRA